jgi:hypothetical protein
MLKVSLELTAVGYEHTGDYFADSASVFASIPEGKARELLTKTSRDKHRGFQDQLSISKAKLRELLDKPLEDWLSYELGALLESLIDVDEVESEVFQSMAVGSDCFFFDSAINWKTYEAAAEELRQAKKREWEGPGRDYMRAIPRSIRVAPALKVEHPCEGLSIAEVIYRASYSRMWCPDLLQS